MRLNWNRNLTHVAGLGITQSNILSYLWFLKKLDWHHRICPNPGLFSLILVGFDSAPTGYPPTKGTDETPIFLFLPDCQLHSSAILLPLTRRERKGEHCKLIQLHWTFSPAHHSWMKSTKSSSTPLVRKNKLFSCSFHARNTSKASANGNRSQVTFCDCCGQD